MCTVRFKNKDDWKASKQYSLTESTFSLAESRVCRQKTTKNFKRPEEEEKGGIEIWGTYLFVLIQLVGADWHVAVGDTFWNVVPVLPGNKWTTSFSFLRKIGSLLQQRSTQERLTEEERAPEEYRPYFGSSWSHRRRQLVAWCTTSRARAVWCCPSSVARGGLALQHWSSSFPSYNCRS